MGALYRARGARSAVTRYPEAAEAAQTAEAVLPAVDARARYRLACIYARRTQQHFGRWQDYKNDHFIA